MTEQQNTSRPSDSAPATHLRELTVQAVFEPNNEAAITHAASTFARQVGSLAVIEPELRIYTPQELDHDEQQRAQAVAVIEKRMNDAGFNDKERAVTRLILLDMTYHEIAHELGISVSAVARHAQGAHGKSGSRTRTGLGAYLQGFAKGKDRAALIASSMADLADTNNELPDELMMSDSVYEQAIRYYKLSSRESEVALLAKDGLSNSEIGEELQLAEATIKDYMSKIFTKMNIRKRSQIGTKLVSTARPGIPQAPSPEVQPTKTNSVPKTPWKTARTHWLQGKPLAPDHLEGVYRLSKAQLLEDGLERRAIDVAMFIAKGLGDAEIARRMDLRPPTIQGHLKDAFALTGQDSRPGLAYYVLMPTLKEIVSLSLGPLELSGHTAEQRRWLVEDILGKRCRRLMETFGLTPREQEITLVSLIGVSLREVATVFGLARSGLYHHTRSIFEKTTTNKNRVLLLRKIYGIDPA